MFTVLYFFFCIIHETQIHIQRNSFGIDMPIKRHFRWRRWKKGRKIEKIYKKLLSSIEFMTVTPRIPSIYSTHNSQVIFIRYLDRFGFVVVVDYLWLGEKSVEHDIRFRICYYKWQYETREADRKIHRWYGMWMTNAFENK